MNTLKRHNIEESLESRYLYEYRIIQMLSKLPDRIYIIQYRPEGTNEWLNYVNPDITKKGEVSAFKTLKEAEDFVERAKKIVEYLLIKEC